jgi:hypothetical protein
MTPAWFGGYAIGPPAAAHLLGAPPAPVRTTAWSPQPQATFADAMALGRRAWGRADHWALSGAHPEVVKLPRSLLERLTEALCDAASLDKVELR